MAAPARELLLYQLMFIFPIRTTLKASLYTRVSEAQSAVVNDSPVGCQSRRPGCPQAAFGRYRDGTIN